MNPQLPRVLEGRRRWMFVRLVLNGFAQAACAVGTALLVDVAFDRLLTGAPNPPRALVPVAAGLLVATACTALLRSLERTGAERLGQQYVHRVRLRLFDRLVVTAPRT